ncbi:hypothetical protein [Candidatus Chrysopegis kryptomonas]|nr:hypothetical protein [Candidatus Chrysopegis kryptomonas]
MKIAILMLAFFTLGAFAQKDGKLKIQQIKNATVHCVAYDTTIKLKNGKFLLDETTEEGFRNYLEVSLVEDKIAFGDVDGDGDEDAVIILASTGGGSGYFYEVGVILNQNGKPEYLTGEVLGDRVKVNFVKILSDRSILIDMVVHGEDDPMCCPSTPKIIRYKVARGKLKEID